MPATRRSGRTRDHSFGGCTTCRQRKLKCDERQPICERCSRGGFTCGGYKAKIQFIYCDSQGVPTENDGTEKDASSHRRRILFSDSERARMSEEMQRLAPQEDIDIVLEQLDLKDGISGFNFTQGPFGVSRMYLGGYCDSEAAVVSSPSPAELPIVTAQHLTTGETSNLLTINALEIEVEDDILPAEDAESLDSMLQRSLMESDNMDALIAFSTPLGISEIQATDAASTQFLLEHYMFQTDKLFSPIRTRKPPWAILHYPGALSAYSELTLFSKTSHARSALLHSVLAVSAFNWDKINAASHHTDFWWSMGNKLRQNAKRELQFTCSSELSGDKRSKYKEILMAMLNMVTISVVTGQQDEARAFLLNAEAFINFRGLPKVGKSRKIKLLHSIYLFLRIIEESTYIYPTDLQPGSAATGNSEHLRFPSLRTHSLLYGNADDPNLKDNFETDLMGGFNDESSFFEQVYGFPEQLLSFISRTSAVANELQASSTTSQNAGTRYDLGKRCKDLEDEICSWNSYNGIIQEDINDFSSATANLAVMPYLITAIHSAVIVYFYRRVRGLNALLLQTYSEKTMSNLELFEQAQLEFSMANCGVVWPAFISGCEAGDSGLQDRYNRFLRRCANSSGMRNFDVAADFLSNLWNLRKTSGDTNLSWMRVVQEQRVPLVLT